MSILTGLEIERQVELGNIIIDPFDVSRVGPNSVDVCLGPTLFTRPIMREGDCLDLTKKVDDWVTITIPDSGYVLSPGEGYLGHTIERMQCKKFVPWLDGRSSTGRYFLMAHMTAGRGDINWNGCWTLELMAMYRPVRVYAGLPICQVTFFTVDGEITDYKGRYNNQPAAPMPPKPFTR